MTAIVETQQSVSAPGIVRVDNDPLGWRKLPKSVRATLRRLRRARDDARLVWRASVDEREQAKNAKHAIESRLKFLTGGRADSPWFAGVQSANFQRLPDDDLVVMNELEKLKDAKEDVERLNRSVDGHSNQAQQLTRLVSALESYLGEGLSNFTRAITLHSGAPPQAQKREAPANAVERLRQRLRTLNADRHRVECAPWHSADAKARARAEIDGFAERGKPNVLPLVDSHDATVAWAERTITDTPVAGRLVTAIGDPQALPLLFWVHREALIQRIEAEIDSVSDDESALTARERKDQLEVIDRDRLAVQREEEFFIGTANEAGVSLLRRPDADPRAVFSLSDDLPNPVVA